MFYSYTVNVFCFVRFFSQSEGFIFNIIFAENFDQTDGNITAFADKIDKVSYFSS